MTASVVEKHAGIVDNASSVARLVFDNNLARVARPADCEAFIRIQVYKPEYCNLA
jgi:hypothetical protein